MRDPSLPTKSSARTPRAIAKLAAQSPSGFIIAPMILWVMKVPRNSDSHHEARQMIAGTAAILVLLCLAGVHFYWAAGGKAGKGAAITAANGRPVIKPSAFATMMVGVGLCAMAAVLALRTGWLDLPVLPRERQPRRNRRMADRGRVRASRYRRFSLRRILQKNTRQPFRQARHVGLFAALRVPCAPRRCFRKRIKSHQDL